MKEYIYIYVKERDMSDEKRFRKGEWMDCEEKIFG